MVICVYTEDRWDDILAAVASVQAQTLPAQETLLVVDHNPALLRRLGARYATVPGIRVLANGGPRGLSAGRNTGIAASVGDIIVFLDDDAVAVPDWLQHLVAAYDDPRVLAVGGRVVPSWASGVRPAWFPAEFDWVVGCTYHGIPPGRVRVRNVLGGNASFRREAFEAAGGFATGIGRDGDPRPLGCEETELCIRLARARPDALLLIDDRAVIHHRVPASRERFEYFRTRVYAEGLSKALVSGSVGARAGLETERQYVARVLPAALARGLRDALLGRPGGAGRAGAVAVGLSLAAGGYALGRIRARRSGQRPAAGGRLLPAGGAAAPQDSVTPPRDRVTPPQNGVPARPGDPTAPPDGNTAPPNRTAPPDSVTALPNRPTAPADDIPAHPAAPAAGTTPLPGRTTGEADGTAAPPPNRISPAGAGEATA